MRKIFTLLVLLCTTVMALQAQYTEDFESGFAGWTAENIWKHGNNIANQSGGFPIPAHTDFMAVNDDAAGENFDGSGRLISPPFDLTGLDFPFLRFEAYFPNLDYAGADETAKVLVSSDDGTTWKEIADLAGGGNSWYTAYADVSEYGNQTIRVAFAYDDGNGYNYGFCVDDVEFYQGAANDVRLVNFNVERFLPAGNMPVSVEVNNLGYETVTSLEFTWIENGVANTETVTGLSIKPLTTATVVHPTTFDGTQASQHDFAVAIDKPNGAVDANMMNNNSDGTVSFVVDVPTKVVVAEEKTGTWCTWCPRGDIFLRQMVANYPDNFIGIAVHNADPMADAEYDSALSAAFPGGYPNVIMARDQLMDPSAMPGQIDNYLSRTSPVSVTGSAKYNGATNEVEVTMTVTSHTEIDGVRFNVSAVLIENEMSGTTSDWAQVNAYSGGNWGPMGGYENLPNPVPASQMVYDHVGRKLIGGFAGDATVVPNSLVDGTQATTTLTATVPEDARRKKMEVVVLVTDRTTGEIYNAAEIHEISGIYPRFRVAEAVGCGPFEAQFIDDSDSTATSMWTFVGGTPATSTEKNPTVVYDGEGEAFDVRLDVVSSTGESYTVVENDIVRLDKKTIAEFEYEVDGRFVDFFDKSTNGFKYAWDFGDGGTSTKRNPNRTYMESGYYNVVLTIENGACSDVFTQGIFAVVTGVDDVLESSWSLSAAPNPFSDDVQINYDLGDNNGESQLVVYNYMGQELFSQNLDNQSGNVKLGAELPQGIFFVQVRQDQKISQILKVTKVK